MIGYHTTHHTQGSRVMYLNSADADTLHEDNTTHFSFTFNEAIHTRAGEGVLVSVLSASIPYSLRDTATDTYASGKTPQRTARSVLERARIR